MSKSSQWERLFARLWNELEASAGVLAPTEEYEFCPNRKWRFDLAWPDVKVAVELHGAVWARGRHVRGSGFIAECDKRNAAAQLGWLVFEFTDEHMRKKPVQCVEMVAATVKARVEEEIARLGDVEELF